MYILKRLSRLELCTHRKNFIAPLKNVSIQECWFRFRYFSCKFYCQVVVICLFNELCYFYSVFVQSKNVSFIISFPYERLKGI